jgi:predicted choloylglycine hydrolase
MNGWDDMGYTSHNGGHHKMMSESSVQGGAGDVFEVRYQHVIVEGTPYEAGKLQAEFLKSTGRPLISYDPPEPEKTAREMRRLYDQYCPGLNDELQGVADGLGLPFEKALFCAYIGLAAHHCSHVVALPAITADHHVHVGRVYDLSLEGADLRLCTTRIKGKAQHLGFSEMLSGRNDGINSHGLCVTMSSSWDQVPGGVEEGKGLYYPVAVRALLEHCQTVGEALEFLQRTPILDGVNLMVADRAGNAALVEIGGGRRAIKTVNHDSVEQYLLSTNHYTLLGASEHNPNSTARYEALRTWLTANAGRINREGLKGFFAREGPEGVCGYSRELRIGSLWSMVFDLSEGTIEVRFGPPPHNGWHAFTLDGPVGVNEYQAVFPGKRT